MFQVGDKVKIIKNLLPDKYHERVGDFSLTYEIKEIDNEAILVVIFNNYHSWNLNKKYIELNYNYYRRKKIEMICSKLEIE